MKNYADLYAESPRAFLRKLEEDIKSLEARLTRLDRLASEGVGNLLAEYERLSLLIEQKAYGVSLEEAWQWGRRDRGQSGRAGGGRACLSCQSFCARTSATISHEIVWRICESRPSHASASRSS